MLKSRGRLNFELLAEAPGSRARAGHLTTLHGKVLTPVFMPVGTQATVRNQTVQTLKESGSQVLLANTYHLLLRPGPEVFKKAGGIHKFMNWSGSVLTDSGGFQIFSLPNARTMNEKGASFKSFVDSRKILLTPELSIEMQKAIGSDIMMVLDQCVPSTCDRQTATDAMELTFRWAKRSLAARGDSPQSMFGIVQGACFEDLRRASADQICSLPFDGFAIGGLAVGETRQERQDFTELTAALLPRDMPRYLMGVGTPLDLLEAVHRGVDMFDCIIPVAWAQQGVAFTSQGRIDLRRGVHRLAEAALDPECHCSTCAQYSRSYLNHLIKASESLGWQLVGLHNLHFYHRLMREMRAAILDGTFAEYHKRKQPLLEARDLDNPSKPGKARKKRLPPLSIGDYEVHVSEKGFSSIRQMSSGETMHSVSDPWVEARKLYVEQVDLKKSLSDASLPPLVIWDVGLGAATNAMAAIREAEESDSPRSLEIVSFECDLDPLKLALKHSLDFKYLRHAAPNVLLERGEWSSKNGKITWRLHSGDIRETYIDASKGPRPDLIYYDPFSPKVDSPLWTAEWFARLRQVCGNQMSQLFTYSASTAVRAQLLKAGWWVARGVPTGPKTETTIALTGRMPERELLGAEWLGRWERSHVFDAGLDHEIRRHPQFLIPS